MATDLRKGWGIDSRRANEDAAAAEAAAQKEAERAARVKRANEDPEFFCNYYLPHYFPTPLAEWQHLVIAEMEADPIAALAVAAPRGHGKTTFVGFGLTLRDLLRGASKFTVYIGPTAGAAQDRIAEIRQELENNERIIEDYGDQLKTLNATPLKKAADKLQLANGACIVARGFEQSMRGIKSRQNRPDRLVVDDADKDGEVLNADLVERKIKKFRGVMLGLAGAAGMAVLVIGNVIARSTFLTWALKFTKKFSSYTFSAIQEDGTPLMPLFWTMEKLEAKREEVGPTIWATEYQNMPPDETTRPFRDEWLKRFWTREQLAALPPGIYVALDLSKGKSERSDFQALVAILRGVDGSIYVIKADLGRRTKAELVNRCFTFCEALGLERIVSFVVEANGFQEWFKEELEKASAERGMDLPIYQVTNTVDKYGRVTRLSPMAEGGRLWFPPELEQDESMQLLIRQLALFPDDRHDDGPDSLAMAVEESARRVRGSGARAVDLRIYDREMNGGEWP